MPLLPTEREGETARGQLEPRTVVGHCSANCVGVVNLEVNHEIDAISPRRLLVRTNFPLVALVVHRIAGCMDSMSIRGISNRDRDEQTLWEDTQDVFSCRNIVHHAWSS